MAEEQKPKGRKQGELDTVTVLLRTAQRWLDEGEQWLPEMSADARGIAFIGLGIGNALLAITKSVDAIEDPHGVGLLVERLGKGEGR